MPVILHADDFGITRSTTQGILNAWANGTLDRFSVMANGRHCEWGSRILATMDRQPLRLAVHLNILEGQPLSSPTEAPQLFSTRNCFPFSFLSLLHWQRKTPQKRQELSQTIYNEWFNQILLAQKFFPGVKAWSIDSHQHIHIIPWLWEIVLRLARNFNLAEIRIPRDALFQFISLGSPRHWPKPHNMAKVRLINHLIKQNFYHKLYHPLFVGGLFYSGEMQRFPLSKLINTLRLRDEEIELLYHPGDDSPLSPQDQLAFPGFYQHLNRQKELEALLNLR